MSRLLARVAVAIAVLCLAPAASAAGSPPPPPTATGGQQVTEVANNMTIPTAFAFGDGEMFGADAGSQDLTIPGGVFLIKGGLAARLDGSPKYVAGIAWHHGTLYVSGGAKLSAWTGWNGAQFTERRTIYTAPRRFSVLNGLGFGADGRLYVGVGLIENGPLNDDHGSTSLPFARSILSFAPAGNAMRVVATGIRQPWQMTFPAGSSSPFVSDLGQDAGANQRLVSDFVLRVTPGQDYGFPGCNWVVLRACAGRPRPWRFLAPHTDPMGLGIIGQRLYIAEFGATTPPRVVSMPLAGGKLTTLLSGFGDTIVGLSTHAGSVFVGDTAGQVYRVTP